MDLRAADADADAAGWSGAALRSRRESANLTQQQLARRAGVSVGTVRSLEQGRTLRPSAASASRLAGALGLQGAEAERFQQAAAPAGGGPDQPGCPRTGGSRTRGLWLRVLGPVEVWRNGRLVTPTAAKHRAVLAVLALAANAPVSREQIIDAIWEQNPPASAFNLVQAYIGRLRRVLEPGRAVKGGQEPLQTLGTSYLLRLTAGQLDSLAFGELADQARMHSQAGDHATACDAFEQALGLWQGEPLTDVNAVRSHPAVAGLMHEKSAVIAGYAQAAAQLGQPERAMAQLRALIHREPLNEKAHALLMVALAGAGQQAPALQVFEDVRRRLDEQLGVRPGPDLTQAQLRVLRQDIGRPAGPGPAGLMVPRQLPPAVRHFVGRRAELEVLSGLAGQAADGSGTVAIAVISGTAGIGKSALAVQFAHQAAGRFPDGQLHADLRGFGPGGRPAEPAETIHAFLGALGVPADQIPPDPQAQGGLYRSLLADRRVLVVLDNARDAGQVRPLLPGSPGCMAVVTSRNPLTSLAAAEGAQLLSPGLLSDGEACELLERRLGKGRAGEDPGARDEMIELCARLPLALTIAAARAAHQDAFPLAALASELRQSRLDLLSTGDAVTDVRAVFSWSYQSLSDPASRAFRLLGIHPGPDISLAAAASLLGTSQERAHPLLAELTRAQLIAQRAPGRYGFHDLLRAYAAEQAEAAENDAARQDATERVLSHYLHTVHAAALRAFPARDRIELLPVGEGVHPEEVASGGAALAWFQAEHRVLLAVTSWAAALGRNAHTWQLAWGLADWLLRAGHWRDAVTVQQEALRAAQRLGDLAAEGYSHRVTGRALMRSGEPQEAEAHLRRSVQVYCLAGDATGRAHSLLSLGRCCDLQGRPGEALSHAREALGVYRSAGHRSGQANCLNAIGWCYLQLNHYHDAITCCLQAFGIQRELGDQFGEASTLDSLGDIHRRLSHYDDAVDCYQRSARLREELGDLLSQATTLSSLGDAYQEAGQLQAAAGAWRQALGILDALKHQRAATVHAKLDALPPECR